MTNQSNLEQGTLVLMEDLSEMLRAQVLPTHLPLCQLIDKICKDPTLKQVDLYSKYTRLGAVVGGDWVTVKEELRNATSFGVPAFYCSISAMLAVFTCRRSRSHDELVSSLTELYNHIFAGNKILNQQVEHAITTMGKQEKLVKKAEASITNIIDHADHATTAMEKQVEQVKNVEVLNKQVEQAIITMGKQMEQVNIAEERFTDFCEQVDYTVASMTKQEKLLKKAKVSITNIIEQADYGTTAMEKQVEQVKKVEESIANVTEAHKAINTNDKQTEQTNVINKTTPPNPFSSEEPIQHYNNISISVIPGTRFHCKYGTLTIDKQYQCNFIGSSLKAKKLAIWFTLPVTLKYLGKIMNLDHEELIRHTNVNLENLNALKNYNADEIKHWIDAIFDLIKYKPGQWSYIC